MLGRSPTFLAASQLIRKIARCDAPVLIEGETGTGKELAARAIHYGGSRRDRPFIPINCGAIPDGLVESELFGHTPGAFTDAKHEQVGLIAHAHRGTLFLDEIDALPAKAQVALLRFLQDQHYRPIGGRETRSVDVRVISASNTDLATLAQAGAFRLDLLFRLKVMHLLLPPLRDRRGDAALLAEHFLEACGVHFGNGRKTLAPATLEWLEQYPWPGNVRELENLITREYLLAEGNTLDISSPADVSTEHGSKLTWRNGGGSTIHFNAAKSQVIAEFERRYLMDVLAAAGGQVTRAASLAGKERRAFGKLLKKHGIDRSKYQL